MADSPLDGIEDNILSVTVKLNGAVMNDTYGIESLEVNHALNKISSAELVIRTETEIVSDKIDITDLDEFNPGVEVEILASYNVNAADSIFKGIIVKHTVELSLEADFRFRIVCKHASVKMTYNQKDRYFEDKTDDAVINEIVKSYNINCNVTASTDKYENMYQRMATDWDFILSRSEYNGFIISQDNNNGVLSIGVPNISANAVLKIEAGVSIISFEGTLNAEYQPASVEASAWDPKTLALIKSTATEPALNSQGNVKAKDLPVKITQEQLNIMSTTPMTSSELKTWADGTLLRRRLNALRGKVRFIGNGKVKTGDIITLSGVGKKLNGDAFVSGITHVVDSGNWNTTVIFGLENNPVYQAPRFSYAAATGQLPAVQGLQLARVKKLEEDPAGNYRVQVLMPSSAETAAATWARMAGFYATNAAGLFFLPEVGDEVVLGFCDNDPRYPVILGSLYNGKNASPYAAEAKNSIKAIVTKSKIKIEFDDEKKIMTLSTPAKNSVVISDDGKSIEIKDQNNNNIKLSSDGIIMNAVKDINISAKGSINIDAVSKVNITSKADVAISGLNINATANLAFAGKGNATAELSASGQTTVKGAIVMIN